MGISRAIRRLFNEESLVFAGGAIRGRLLLLLFLLSACAHQQPTPQMRWVRIDGGAVDPVKGQQSLVQCRGEAATVAANSPQATYPNIYLLAIAEGQRNQTLDAILQACMGKAGYMLVQAPN